MTKRMEIKFALGNVFSDLMFYIISFFCFSSVLVFTLLKISSAEEEEFFSKRKSLFFLHTVKTVLTATVHMFRNPP